MARTITLVSMMLIIVLSGCSDPALELGPLQQVDTPAQAGSLAPNLAVGLDGELYLSWVEPNQAGHALRFSTWADEGWSTPKTVAQGDDWFVNWADFPSMTALEDGTLAAHWLVKSGGATYAYDVMVALSHDGGTTWSNPFSPHRDGTSTEHGFVSLVPSSEGHFDVVWLDGRNTASTPPGAMTIRFARLFPDGTLGDEAVIDESVCDCCSTDALITGGGATLVAYRDRSESEVRDISTSRQEGAVWSTPQTVNPDNWVIAACPVNGPAVAGTGDLVALAWFSAADGVPSVQLAFSRDGGHSVDRPFRVDHGNPLGRVDVTLLDDATALVSWLERVEDQAQIFLRQVGRSGPLESRLVTTTTPARSSGFPRVALFQEQVVLVWTQAGTPSGIASAAFRIGP